MPMLLRVRIALAIIAIAILLYGVRNDISWLRWVAIGILAVAIILRVVDRLRAK